MNNKGTILATLLAIALLTPALVEFTNPDLYEVNLYTSPLYWAIMSLFFGISLAPMLVHVVMSNYLS